MTTATEPNIDLLVQALAQIELEPETWRQWNWAIAYEPLADAPAIASAPSCGTAYCLAGHICVQAGIEIAWSITSTGVQYRTWIDAGTCDGRSVRRAALDALGIPDDTIWGDADEDGYPQIVDELFSASNDRDALYAIAAQLFGIDRDDLVERVRSEVATRGALAASRWSAADAEILERAAQLIERNGLNQDGSYYDIVDVPFPRIDPKEGDFPPALYEGTALCAVGAVSLAAGVVDENGDLVWSPPIPAIDLLERTFASKTFSELGISPFFAVTPVTLTTWNDEPTTDAGDVVRLLKEAAEAARADG